MAQSLVIRPSDGHRTWTVIDDGYQTVGPVEQWLKAHRRRWSPNTLRGHHATSPAQWWTFLEQRGEADRWRDVGVPTVSAFLSWLRNGRTVEHALVAFEAMPSPETLERHDAAAIASEPTLVTSASRPGAASMPTRPSTFNASETSSGAQEQQGDAGMGQHVQADEAPADLRRLGRPDAPPPLETLPGC